MLVLSRKKDEAVLIGDDIKITVIKVHGNSVRVGIEAPANIRIVRSELPQWGEGRFERVGPGGREVGALPVAELPSSDAPQQSRV